MKKALQVGQVKDWKTALFLLTWQTWSMYLNSLESNFVFLRLSSGKFSKFVSTYNIYVVKQNIEC